MDHLSTIRKHQRTDSLKVKFLQECDARRRCIELKLTIVSILESISLDPTDMNDRTEVVPFCEVTNISNSRINGCQMVKDSPWNIEAKVVGASPQGFDLETAAANLVDSMAHLSRLEGRTDHELHAPN